MCIAQSGTVEDIWNCILLRVELLDDSWACILLGVELFEDIAQPEPKPKAEKS